MAPTAPLIISETCGTIFFIEAVSEYMEANS